MSEKERERRVNVRVECKTGEETDPEAAEVEIKFKSVVSNEIGQPEE